MGTTPQSKFQAAGRVASAVRDFLLGAMGLGCLALGILMAVIDKLPAAGILFTAGLLLCVFSSLSRFESIKGLGIEAKMAALDNKLHEADKLLAHIRDSVGLMADISFQTMARVGFWDSAIPKRDALVLADAFRKQLKDLGENEAAINARMAPWHDSNIRRLASPIFRQLREFVQIQNQQLTIKANNFPQPINAGDPEWLQLHEQLSKNGTFLQHLSERWGKRPADFAIELDSLVNLAPFGTAEEKQKLIASLTPVAEDVRYYVSNKDFRDRERWINNSED